MKQIVDSYFDFSRTERTGFMVLALLMVLFVAFPTVYRFAKKPVATDFSNFKEAIVALELEQTKALPTHNTLTVSLFKFNPNTLSPDSLALLGLNQKVVNNIVNYRNKGGRFFKKEDFKKIYSLPDSIYQKLVHYIFIPQTRESKPAQVSQKFISTEKTERSILLKSFDPNTADKETLLDLGLSQKVTNTILNFRNKGGRFYKKEDLQKIYGLSMEQFKTLEEYIVIEKTKKESKSQKKLNKNNALPAKKKARTSPIDINKATAEEFQELKGIGPYYSKKIISFREKLGGYANINQVAEVYGLPDSVFQKIKPLLKSSVGLKKININKATAKELATHPYLNYKLANIIIKYRKQHGPYKSIDDLKNTVVIKQDVIDKIRPYLEL